MNQLKSLLLIGFWALLLSSCGSKPPASDETDATEQTDNADATSESGSDENPSYDPNRGLGKYTEVELEAKLDATMAENGQKAYDVKCSSCHKLTEEKLVGPGWSGVTTRRKAPWIMNFITNTDAMIDKDPAVQAQLEICLVRMPNQSLTDNDARALLEFMRKNDGVQ